MVWIILPEKRSHCFISRSDLLSNRIVFLSHRRAPLEHVNIDSALDLKGPARKTAAYPWEIRTMYPQGMYGQKGFEKTLVCGMR
jgi:hypothetical protein